MANRTVLLTEDTSGASCPLVAGSIVPSGTPGYYQLSALSLSGTSVAAVPNTVPLRDASAGFETAYLTIDPTPTVVQTGGVGKLVWNDIDGTIEFQLKGGNVTLQLGQEQVLRVRNQEVTPLTDGTVVYLNGSTGIHMSAYRADNSTEPTSDRTIGVVTEPIAAHPGEGYITTFGLVRGIDTNHLVEGQLVYLGTGGATTATKPVAPLHQVIVGYCVKKAGAASGVLFVSVQVGYELGELHDVLISSAISGNLLRYDGTKWINTNTLTTDLTISNNASLIMSQAAIFNLTRTIPTVVGNYVELASITNVDFAGNVEVWYNAHNNNFAQSKRYFLPLSYNATGSAWQKLLAFSSTGAYVGNDADLEINVTLGTAYFRIRRTAGTTAGVADVVFLLGGSADETTWTPLTGTGVGAAPTAFYSVKADGTNSDFVGGGLTSVPFTNRSLIQAGNFPTIGGAYSLSSWAGTGVRVPFFAVCPTNNGGSTPAAAQVVAVLGREGVNSQAYANFAEIKLRRYEHSGVNARTAMTIALTHGSNASAGTDVLDLKSNGDVALSYGNLVLPKTQGTGIQVDPASPSFGWRDMLGEIVARGTGVANPTWSAFRGGIYGYQFASASVNEVWTQFHIPHDWLPGTPLYVHVHWAQNVVDTGGTAGVPGAAKWYFELSYADGYGTPGGAGDPFTAPLTVSVVQQGSTTQYAHMIGEVQCGVAGGSGGTMLDTSTIQVDGLILCHLYRDKTDPSDTLNQGPFIFMCDMHYQSNGVMGTKTKNFPFYT